MYRDSFKGGAYPVLRSLFSVRSSPISVVPLFVVFRGSSFDVSQFQQAPLLTTMIVEVAD